MTCREAEKLIPQFVDRSINKNDYYAFIDHINGCPSCKDDAEIEFLVSVGLKFLEDGETFRLDEVFEKNKQAIENKFVSERKRKRIKMLFYLLIHLLVFIFILTIFIYINIL